MRNLSRWLYLAQRAMGDADAIRRGRYTRRLARRAGYRAAWRLLRRIGL